MKTERVECLHEILEVVGVKATTDQIKKIAEDFALHLEMENEIASYQFRGGSQECGSCERLRSEITQKDKELEVYINSVKRRRNASEVWLENDNVKYR